MSVFVRKSNKSVKKRETTHLEFGVHGSNNLTDIKDRLSIYLYAYIIYSSVSIILLMYLSSICHILISV